MLFFVWWRGSLTALPGFLIIVARGHRTRDSPTASLSGRFEVRSSIADDERNAPPGRGDVRSVGEELCDTHAAQPGNATSPPGPPIDYIRMVCIHGLAPLAPMPRSKHASSSCRPSGAISLRSAKRGASNARWAAAFSSLHVDCTTVSTLAVHRPRMVSSSSASETAPSASRQNNRKNQNNQKNHHERYSTSKINIFKTI